MTVLETRITQSYNGKLTPCEARFEFPISHSLNKLINNTQMVLYMSDPLISRWIPECIDESATTSSTYPFVLIHNVYENKIFTINVEDVERCWYDDCGISDELAEFLGGIILMDDRPSDSKWHWTNLSGDQFPAFKSIMSCTIPNLNII